jgi:hypothetical protein
MNSERGLTELLRTHLKLGGLPSSHVLPVKRWDGKSGRVDRHLAGQSKEHDRIRHLIVELKAPGITLGRKELDQVEDYTNTVLTNSAFSSARSHWDFVLVGTDFDELVDNRLNTENHELGEFLSPPKKPGRPQVRAYVVAGETSWTKIIAAWISSHRILSTTHRSAKDWRMCGSSTPTCCPDRIAPNPTANPE